MYTQTKNDLTSISADSAIPSALLDTSGGALFRVSVRCVLISNDGKSVLLVPASRSTQLTFPGGYVGKDETLVSCLQRTVFERYSDIDQVGDPVLSWAFSGDEGIVILYHARLKMAGKGKPAEGAAWKTWADIENLELSPSDRSSLSWARRLYDPEDPDAEYGRPTADLLAA